MSKQNGLPMGGNIAQISMFAAGAIIALQECIQRLIMPERFKVEDVTHPADRLERLAEHLLREVKNFPAQGMAEADEAAGKAALIATLEQIVRAVRKDLDHR